MTFESSSISPLNGVAGLYFVFSQTIDIQYPFGKSKLLYIGMSERKTNSIGSRLLGWFISVNFRLGHYCPFPDRFKMSNLLKI